LEKLATIGFYPVARETYYKPGGEVVSGEVLRIGYINCPLVASVNLKEQSVSLAVNAGGQTQILVGNSNFLFHDLIESEKPAFIEVIKEWYNQWKSSVRASVQQN
jgi:hypothetical protein